MTDPTHATITFQSLTNNGNIYLFGGRGAVAVNVNTTGVVSTSTVATGSNSGMNFPRHLGMLPLLEVAMKTDLEVSMTNTIALTDISTRQT